MAEADKEDELEAGRMPLLDHLIELRNRLMWAFGSIIVGFLVCYQFKQRIYDFWPIRCSRSLPASRGAR